MTPNRYIGPAMMLGNMRANGVRRLDARRCNAHHKAMLDVDQCGDDVRRSRAALYLMDS
jgi:hypothetical protein